MIAALWWWLATTITQVRSPIDPNAKLQCVSYAPFRGAQTPLMPTTQISPEQIAQDLAQLAKITDCVRTFSIENGLDQVPALAAKLGLKVIQGIWLSSNRIKNLAQIAVAVELTFQRKKKCARNEVGDGDGEQDMRQEHGAVDGFDRPFAAEFRVQRLARTGGHAFEDLMRHIPHEEHG